MREERIILDLLQNGTPKIGMTQLIVYSSIFWSSEIFWDSTLTSLKGLNV